MSCGNAIPVCSPSARTASTAIERDRRSWSPSTEGGYTCIHPTPKPIPGGRSRSESVSRLRLSGSDDDDPVHLDAVDEPFEDGRPRRRLFDRLVEVALELGAALDPEDGPLAARVGRLQHRGEAHAGQSVVDAFGRAKGGVRGLRYVGGCKCVTHLELVRHPLRGLDSDSREPECVRDSGHDWHRPVRSDREHSVGTVPAAHLDDGLDVREVDELAYVGGPEAECIGIAVDSDDAMPELLRMEDRAALMAAAADEQERLHRVPSAFRHVAGEPSRR